MDDVNEIGGGVALAVAPPDVLIGHRAARSGVEVTEISPEAAEAMNEFGLGWVEMISPGQSARHGFSRRQNVGKIERVARGVEVAH